MALEFSIALWCVLAAGLLPLLTVYPAKFDRKLDNRDPSARHARQTGLRRRAFAAHRNGFEAFPLFAVAVIVAGLTGADQARVDALALAFVALRVLFTVAYFANLSLVRSGLFALGLGVTIAIYTAAIWA
ncbi:MAPEG family protein [Acuticoccus sp. I52.16.1]|uniref:MAPEG family protein n=1 Tax=Acuticoccus sp. I52.16.1 TaxID=2928472 RepID=UPI001FD3A9EC|nr:MAPEG family protein [Acuticoccus sp. I52.16.1]UOM32817.1 MAPEG family protein [Acuticoccus sp. I52.16.1]